MAKLVYAVDSNSTPEMVVGSNPTLGTICARGEIGKHMRFKPSRLRVLRVRVPPGALKLSRKFGIFLINLSLGAQFYIIILYAKRLQNNRKVCFYIKVMDWIKATKEGMGLILNLMEPKIEAHIERITAGVA